MATTLPPPPPPKAICAHCGTVTAVTPVQRDGAGSGAGAVAGAVLGGLLGNQVGGGTGKTLATVVGAVGGGYAGNTVEKRMKKETVYQIDLRMEDGSTRRLEHASPLSVGAHVTVANGVISQ
jgi:outer membrane lipoprotein SlyB